MSHMCVMRPESPGSPVSNWSPVSPVYVSNGSPCRLMSLSLGMGGGAGGGGKSCVSLACLLIYVSPQSPIECFSRLSCLSCLFLDTMCLLCLLLYLTVRYVSLGTSGVP